MSPAVISSLAGLTAMALGQFAGLLIWGAALTQRVRALERDLEPLRSLDVRVARIDARLEALLEQLRELNASIRWIGKSKETE